LALPAGWQLRLLASKTKLYSLSPPPSLEVWPDILLCGQLSIFIIPVVAILWIGRRWIPQSEVGRFEGPLLFALCVWLYPGVALAAVSVAIDAPVFLQRYALYSVVGESLLQGLLLCGIRDLWSRRLVFVGAILVAAVATPSVRFWREDWRTALNDLSRTSSEPSVLLVWTALVETRDIAWTLAPDKRAYVLAPTAMYPINLPTFPIPRYPTSFPPQSLFNEQDRNVIDSAQRIFIVYRSSEPFISGLRREEDIVRIPWLAPHESFIERSSRKYRGINVLELERAEPRPLRNQ
jgi:hypothetical protein